MLKTNRHIPHYLLLIILLVSATLMKAQVPHFLNYGLLEGIRGYTVKTIYQDKTGYMWFGTNRGLIRFDGIKTEHFTKENGLLNNEVTAISQDSAGVLWIAHRSGEISHYNGIEFTAFEPNEGLPVEEISAIYIDSRGIVWLSTFGEGIYYYRNNRMYNLNSDDGLSDDFAYCFTELPNQQIAVGTDIGISIIESDLSTIRTISSRNGLPDNIVKELKYEFGKLWVGMEDAGLSIMNLETGEFTKITETAHGSVSGFALKDENEAWIISTRDGALRLQQLNATTQKKMYGQQHGLINDRLYGIYRDKEQNLWIAGRNGVTMYPGNTFEFLNNIDGLNFEKTFDVTIDHNNHVLVCTEQGLYAITVDNMGQNKLKQICTDQFLAKSSFVTVFVDKLGYIWAGSLGNGVIRISPNYSKTDHFTTKNGLTVNSIVSISGTEDHVWLSTLGGGAIRATMEDSPVFSAENTETGLGSSYIYSVFTDSQHRTWFAQDGGGISVKKKEKFIVIPEVENLPNVVFSITEDKQGNIWLSGTGEGLYKFDGKHVLPYGKNKGIRSTEISGLQMISDTELLVISNEGFDLLNTETDNLRYYGDDMGVAYRNPQLNGVFATENNEIWVATLSGLIKYSADTDKLKGKMPHITVTGKRLLFDPTKRTDFKYNQNHITFDFIGFWYAAPDKLLYRYQLDGNDPDWSLVTQNHSATYSNLRPGDYNFKVQVSIDGINWHSEEQTNTHFVINSPFWLTWWFIGGSTILIFVIILLIVRYRLQRLQRQKRILEGEVTKRTAEVIKQKEEIEAQRDQIEMKNQNITDSIMYARRIQSAVLPPKELIAESLPDHFIFFKPRDIVSGDYYYFNKKGTKLVLAAADSTGHGVPGAFMSMLGIAFLNDIINKQQELCAGEILTALRSYVKTSLHQTGKRDEAKDGMDIALIVLDTETLELQYAGAHNSLFYVSNREQYEIKADKMPIGIYIKEKEAFTNHTLQMQKGDVLYMYSDGYTDQFGGAKGKKFLRRRLKSLLFEIHDYSPEKQHEVLERTFNEWTDKQEQLDDVLVIGVKV